MKLAAAGVGLILLGLWMAHAAPLLPMHSRVLPNGIEVTEHGGMQQPATVLVVHSIFQGRESSWPMAQALARRGLNAVNVHLRGGLEYPEYVRQISVAVDTYARQGPVWLWGHSMGADLVSEVAGQNSRVVGMVAVGFPVTSSGPRTLLMVGAWDQLHSLREMREAAGLQKAELEVLPQADHNQENFDPESSRKAARFFGAEHEPRWADPFLGRGWLLWGLVLLSAGLSGGPSRRLQCGALVLALFSWRSDPFHSLARGVLMGLVFAQGRAFWLSRAQVLALFLALGLGELVLAWPNWSSQPSLLLQFPTAVLSWLPGGLLKFAGDVPVGGWIAVGLLEVARPGFTMRALGWLPRNSWRQLATFSVRKPRPGEVLVLAGLLVAAALAWRDVAQAGYWPDSGQWGLLATKVGGMVVVPLLVWLMAARGFASRAAQSKR
ncbi:MAG: hypothetical protein J0I12_30230 [Candidatus Eremiobacteraeota bacterium]|nr:hypothetical protein [Candidatus Eremiobacteraeota bacterium]